MQAQGCCAKPVELFFQNPLASLKLLQMATTSHFSKAVPHFVDLGGESVMPGILGVRQSRISRFNYCC
jgi:hypothetical protein